MKDIRIFVDLDGVMTFWMKAACELTNLDPTDPAIRNRLKAGETVEEILETDFWDQYPTARAAEWWENLEILPWAHRLWTFCNDQAPTCFLTSPGKHAGTANAAQGKVRWIEKHFDTMDWFIGKPKYKLAHPNDLLIDDYLRNVKAFKEWGGQTFQWPEVYSLLDGDISIDDTFAALGAKIAEMKAT